MSSLKLKLYVAFQVNCDTLFCIIESLFTWKDLSFELTSNKWIDAKAQKK